ncbi:NAD(P)-dependent oxidoreductase [Streptomyces sp. TRM49041]|uniref:NAD(P)-dependent oxidoreductase n=1 Tax=Streptomyces sp. TRM49041 TaxID=2603216 RepID=UPI0011EBD447|nr:NAD(P)-dependent oxidoreductase [Streptomyces sp. TRM49041]
MTTLTLLHPGSMGAPLAAHAVANGHRVLWVATGRSERTRQRAEKAGFVAYESLGAALGESDAALSVCPPQAAEDMAGTVAQHAFGGIYMDAKAISPQRMQRIADGMPKGCTVLDGSIIGPPPSDGRRARLYLAGPEPAQDTIRALFKDTGVQVRTAGTDLGAASALKMAFAGYQKAARALAGVAHALADHHGVRDLLTEEAHTMTSAILSDPDYLPSVAARAWRWGPEMDEVAETLRAADLPPQVAEATRLIYDRWAQDKDQELPLDIVLAHLRQVG